MIINTADTCPHYHRHTVLTTPLFVNTCSHHHQHPVLTTPLFVNMAQAVSLVCNLPSVNLFVELVWINSSLPIYCILDLEHVCSTV
jgi:hypothetical protein